MSTCTLIQGVISFNLSTEIQEAYLNLELGLSTFSAVSDTPSEQAHQTRSFDSYCAPNGVNRSNIVVRLSAP